MFFFDRIRLVVTILAMTFAVCPVCGSDRPKFPAFPGAEGAGAYTPGGRGGKVLLITTLEDYDPRKDPPISGSLREAITAKGPRTIIFRVTGNIVLKHDLVIHEPFVTIAGQTSPGGGICLTNYGLGIDTHDVVLRYLRVRPGDVEKKECDAISCNGQNVIIDHCSASWGIDEVLSTNGGSANVTVQWCLITESLNQSVHHKGEHGYGSLISGPGEITYHHNLYAYHRSRNPRPGTVLLDFRNNVIYGWRDRAGYCGNERLQLNYVGNDLRPIDYSKQSNYAFLPGGPRPRIYVADNRLFSVSSPLTDDWSLIRPFPGATDEQTRESLRMNKPFVTSEVFTESVERASRRVLDDGGASRPIRDAVDQRVVDQIHRGTGQIINSQSDVGGWPKLTLRAAPADRDGDGMPDDWELRGHLDPAHPGEPNDDHDGDGYTDVEEYLNGTEPREKDFWIYPPTAISDHGNDFVGTTRVTLSSQTEEAQVHYTLDDTAPLRSSPLYSEPLELDRSVTIRACAFVGGRRSHVQNAHFERLDWHEPVTVKTVKPGIQFEYYEQERWDNFPEFSKLVANQSGVSPEINLSPRKREGAFGLRYRGLFAAPRDGVYHFSLRCSPPGQLLMHDQVLVESEGRHCEHEGAIALKAGMHPVGFRIYYPSDDNKTLAILYEGPDIRRQPIPAGSLFHVAE